MITIFRIHSLIVTLGTGTFLHGATLWLSDSMTISGISPSLMNAVIVDRLFGVPLEFYYARFLDYVKTKPDVWICRRLDIAKHWLKEHPCEVA